jgi:hypothetical protein
VCSSDLKPQQGDPLEDPLPDPVGLYLPRQIIKSAYQANTLENPTSNATIWQLLEGCARMKISGLSNNLSNLYFDGTQYYLKNINPGSSATYSDNYIVDYSEDIIALERYIDFSCNIHYNPSIAYPYERYQTGGGGLNESASYPAITQYYLINDKVDLGEHNSFVVAQYMPSYSLGALKSIITPTEIKTQRFSQDFMIKKYRIPLTLSEISSAANAVNVASLKAVFVNGLLFLEIETFIGV